MTTLQSGSRPANPRTRTDALLRAATAHNANPAYIAAGYPQLVSFRATVPTTAGEVTVEFNATPGEELDRLVAIDARARLARRDSIRIERIEPESRPVSAIVLDLATIKQRLTCFYARRNEPTPIENRAWSQLEDRRQATEVELDAAVIAALGVPLSHLISAREG